jgi:hypothetical protein
MATIFTIMSIIRSGFLDEEASADGVTCPGLFSSAIFTF